MVPRIPLKASWIQIKEQQEEFRLKLVVVVCISFVVFMIVALFQVANFTLGQGQRMKTNFVANSDISEAKAA